MTETIEIICIDCKQKYSYPKPHKKGGPKLRCPDCSFENKKDIERYFQRAKVNKCLVCGNKMPKREPQVHIVNCLNKFKHFEERVNKKEFIALQSGGYDEEGQGHIL